jgi:hypothetical protein
MNGFDKWMALAFTEDSMICFALNDLNEKDGAALQYGVGVYLMSTAFNGLFVAFSLPTSFHAAEME